VPIPSVIVRCLNGAQPLEKRGISWRLFLGPATVVGEKTLYWNHAHFIGRAQRLSATQNYEWRVVDLSEDANTPLGRERRSLATTHSQPAEGCVIAFANVGPTGHGGPLASRRVLRMPGGVARGGRAAHASIQTFALTLAA
jgi:hypothetical protein